MSEQKKPQAGEWWFYGETGNRWFCHGDNRDGIPIMEDEAGGVFTYRGVSHTKIHHEPRCTGWDWQPKPLKPAKDPDEWVTQDRVPVRPKIDEITWQARIIRPDEYGGWCRTRTGSTSDGKWHGHKLDDFSILSVRCRRRHLPPWPEKPKTETVTFYEVIRVIHSRRDCRESIISWTTQPCETDIKTGRTETREVVR